MTTTDYIASIVAAIFLAWRAYTPARLDSSHTFVGYAPYVKTKFE